MCLSFSWGTDGDREQYLEEAKRLLKNGSPLIILDSYRKYGYEDDGPNGLTKWIRKQERFSVHSEQVITKNGSALFLVVIATKNKFTLSFLNN